MKKLVLLFVIAMLALQMTACNTQKGNKEKNKTEISSVENNIKEDDGLVTKQTKYFSVKIPKEWEKLCICDIDETSIHFSHKKSYECDYGGYMFGIAVEDLSFFQDAGDVEILGGLKTPEGEEFNIWKLGPSDVQFSDETYEEYSKCMDAMENVLSTLSFNEGYLFTKTPYEIENNEYYMSNYIDYTQYGWPSTYNDTWIHFLNDGGEFYHNEDGEYFCEIYGTTLWWSSSARNWYYINKDWKKFYQWKGSNYYVYGYKEDEYHSEIFSNKCEWLYIDSYGVRKSTPPSDYVTYMNSKKEDYSQKQFNEAVNAWRNNFAYHVYQDENGTWICKAPYGSWTYDPNYIDIYGLSGQWTGYVTIENTNHYVVVSYGYKEIVFFENHKRLAKIIDGIAWGNSWTTVEEQNKELPHYVD